MTQTVCSKTVALGASSAALAALLPRLPWAQS
jgi:hypothetical protein